MRQWEPTPELIETILERLANGDSLREISRSEGMPPIPVFLRWVDKDPKIADQYARARDRQAARYAEEIVEIADTEPDPHKARVRIDARKWVACKLLPKKYGERIQQEISGADGGPAILQIVTKEK